MYILRMRNVTSKIGLSKATIYKMIAEGSFPKPIPIGKRAVGWLEASVEEWMKSKECK